MRAHIVLAHPEQKSFNAQLADISRKVLVKEGFQTTLTDLYAIDFDPREGAHHYHSRENSDVFHVQTEQRFNANNDTIPAIVNGEIQRLLESDLLIVHFPLWWFGMPAILKGWMDRVFVYGKMYRSLERYDAGICAGKKMIACVTTGADAYSCSYNGREGDSLLHLWPVLFPFRYLGFDVLEPEVFHGVGGVAYVEGHEGGLSTLEANFNTWTEALGALSARPLIQYNRDTDFDDSKRLVSGAPVYSPFIRQNPNAVDQ